MAPALIRGPSTGPGRELYRVGARLASPADRRRAAGFRADAPEVGFVVTGVVYTTCGRGSNFLHQFVEQFFPGDEGKGVG
jgi:hypothetical protein